MKHKGKLTRTYSIRGAEIDEETRSVEVAFSSEEPVERFFGTEILDHRAESVRMSRLTEGGPVLVDHDPTDHVGVVERAEINADRRGRAVVRFGRGARATEIFNDVVDGIRHNISVGYQIHRMEEDGDDTYRATDWEPHEISFVSIPADVSVGVGRSVGDDEYEIRVIDKPKEVIQMSEDKKPEPSAPIDPAVIREQAEKLARDIADKRLEGERAIRAAGKAHKLEDLAEQVIERGGDMEEFNDAALKQYRESIKPISTSVEDPDVGKDQKRYSLTRLVRCLADPKNPQLAREAAFELEISGDIAKRSGRDPQGAYVPDFAVRTLSAGTATDGAELVATNLLAERFIDVLRNRTVVAQAGATMLDGLVGDVAIPRKTTASTAAWIATEGGNSANSEPQFDQVTMSPKTLGVYGDYTRQLLLQSTPSIDALLQDDLSVGVGLAIDAAALVGDGTGGAPTGIVSTAGVSTSTIASAGAPTWVELVEFETDVATENADMGALAFVMTAAVRGNLKTTEKATNTAQFIMGEGNEANGYPVYVTQQAAANGIYFGNWNDLLIGMWGGRDILVDPYTSSISGTVRIVALQSVDVAVRHPESFCINA
jgi:HK97 family phage major capsid protein